MAVCQTGRFDAAKRLLTPVEVRMFLFLTFWCWVNIYVMDHDGRSVSIIPTCLNLSVFLSCRDVIPPSTLVSADRPAVLGHGDLDQYLLQHFLEEWIDICLVVWNILFFPLYVGNNHPKWLSYFQRGGSTSNQIWIVHNHILWVARTSTASAIDAFLDMRSTNWPLLLREAGYY